MCTQMWSSAEITSLQALSGNSSQFLVEKWFSAKLCTETQPTMEAFPTVLCWKDWERRTTSSTFPAKEQDQGSPKKLKPVKTSICCGLFFLCVCPSLSPSLSFILLSSFLSSPFLLSCFSFSFFSFSLLLSPFSFFPNGKIPLYVKETLCNIWALLHVNCGEGRGHIHSNSELCNHFINFMVDLWWSRYYKCPRKHFSIINTDYV